MDLVSSIPSIDALFRPGGLLLPVLRCEVSPKDFLSPRPHVFDLQLFPLFKCETENGLQLIPSLSGLNTQHKACRLRLHGASIQIRKPAQLYSLDCFGNNMKCC